MIRNSKSRWGWPSKALHWLGAALLLLLIGHGWWMTHMAPRPDRLAHYAGHSAMGFDLLALTALRLLWRRMQPVPNPPPDSKPWERWSAHATHAGLYVFIFVVCVTGWVTANTMRTPITTDLFGIPFPLIGLDRSLRGWFEVSHKVLAYVLGAIVVVHVLAALRHHFLKHNDVLRRMTWGVRLP